MTTTKTVGSGKYTYEMDEHWAKVPGDWKCPPALCTAIPKTGSSVSTGTRTIQL